MIKRICLRLRALQKYGIGRWLGVNLRGIQAYLRYQKLFLQRGQRRGKTIMVIDDTLLRPDDSTLGRSNAQYVSLLHNLGWQVLLLPEHTKWSSAAEAPQSMQWDEPYARQLEKEGVIVLAGCCFRWQPQRRLQANAAQLDYVLFRWPDQADKYWEFFQTYSQAKLLFLAMDLQATRKTHEYKVTGDPAALVAAQKFSKQEAQIFQRADALLTYSHAEASWLRQHYGDKVFQVPLFIFEGLQPTRLVAPASQQLLFVGNFAHPPNRDGLLWFLTECWPQLSQRCANVKLWVVGALATADIFTLQSAQIAVLGKISDEELAARYRQARVVVAPLRFGAGVKGKVIEALAYGAPVVTTSFGVEGVPGLAEIITPTDTPETMVAALLRLLADDQEWQRISMAGQAFVQQNFSIEAAQKSVAQIFSWLEHPNSCDSQTNDKRNKESAR